MTRIFNGKSWVKAVRSYRSISAALLKRFLSTGPNTFEQLEQYLEIAHLHPTGRHWVDNFLLHTLLIHQFERSSSLAMRSTPVISPSTCWICGCYIVRPKLTLCPEPLFPGTTKGRPTGTLFLVINLVSRLPLKSARELSRV